MRKFFSAKAIVVALVIGIAAFLLGPVIWPRPEDGPMPTSGQLPIFIAVALFEGLAFGFGLVAAVLGAKALRAVRAGNRAGLILPFLSALWLTVSWWPHDNLHQYIEHGDMGALLAIEIGFHVTGLAAALILLNFVLGRFHELRRADAATASPTETRSVPAPHGYDAHDA